MGDMNGRAGSIAFCRASSGEQPCQRLVFIWLPWSTASTILSGFIARGGAIAHGTFAWLHLLEPHVI